MGFNQTKASEECDNVPKRNDLRKIRVIKIALVVCCRKAAFFCSHIGGIIGTGFWKIMGEIRSFDERFLQVRGVLG